MNSLENYSEYNDLTTATDVKISDEKSKRELLIMKGDADFQSAMVSFLFAHHALTVFASELNLGIIANHSSELQEQIQNISKISSEIAKISSQTQILSINATIESSRAGQLGKGFAVVANEIGTLSKRTKDCTDKVDEINVKTLQKSADTLKSIADLKEFVLQTNEMSAEVIGIKKIEENDFIITMLAKRLENHADFINNLLKNAGKLESVTDHNSCTFGKWYNANMDKYKDIPAFANMHETHKKFHDTAKVFNKSLSSKSIMELTHLLLKMLLCFVTLKKAFDEEITTNDSYFNFE